MKDLIRYWWLTLSTPRARRRAQAAFADAVATVAAVQTGHTCGQETSDPLTEQQIAARLLAHLRENLPVGIEGGRR